MSQRQTYETKFWEYLELATTGDLPKMHATALARRQLYADLAAIYYQLWQSAPRMVTINKMSDE